jgi:MFS family permease
MLKLLAIPRLRLYYLSTFISSLGDYSLWLAAGVWVKELTGSTSATGLAMLSYILGTALAPVTGIVVDRFRRKPLLLLGNAGVGLLVLLLLFVHSSQQVWLIYAVLFLYGVGSSMNSSADMALLPQLAPEELLGSANGLTQALIQGLRLITPTVGIGLLTLFGGGALAIMDASTFGVAIVCWSLIKVDETKPEPQGLAWRQETVAGFAFLTRTPILRQLTVALAVAIFGIGFFETLGMAISTVGLHHSPSWVGVIVTSMGVTGLIGGLVVGPLMKRFGAGMLCAIGLGLIALASLTIAVPVDAVVIASCVLFGLGLPWIVASAMTILQIHTPSELLGRVNGASGFVITVAQSIGIGAGAALITVFYYRTLCYFVAAVAFLATVYLATRPEQRKQADLGGSGDGDDAGAENSESILSTGGADALVLNP